MIPRRRHLRNALVVLGVVGAVVLVSTHQLREPADGTGTTASSSSGSDAPAALPVTATSRQHRHHDGSVLVLGDSLTVGAEKAGLSRMLRADGWTVDVDAEEGRSTRGGILAVRVQHPSVPSLVVVELGTNPSSAIGTFAADIDTMLDELAARGATRVLWVTPHFRDDDRYADKDAAVAAAAAKNPMVVVADWHAFALGHGDWMRPDGLHYTESGYAILAAFLADQIDANAPIP